jgi:Domain of unknown function (DUF6602)
MASQLSLRQLFLRHQRVMEASLEGDRETIYHPTSKGDASESQWIRMLCTHLPRRYSVAKAFVLDSRGSTSEQIDVVVFDAQYSPVLRDEGGVLYIPAESVYAVFEVRQELSRRCLKDAAQKAESVRRLHRTSARIPHAGGQFPPKQPGVILAGLLTLRSSWSPPFGHAFVDTLRGLDESESLDLGCALRDGAWTVNERSADSFSIELSIGETALVSFFLVLLAGLQTVATAPAIELDRYAAALPRQRLS